MVRLSQLKIFSLMMETVPVSLFQNQWPFEELDKLENLFQPDQRQVVEPLLGEAFRISDALLKLPRRGQVLRLPRTGGDPAGRGSWSRAGGDAGIQCVQPPLRREIRYGKQEKLRYRRPVPEFERASSRPVAAAAACAVGALSERQRGGGGDLGGDSLGCGRRRGRRGAGRLARQPGEQLDQAGLGDRAREHMVGFRAR